MPKTKVESLLDELYPTIKQRFGMVPEKMVREMGQTLISTILDAGFDIVSPGQELPPANPLREHVKNLTDGSFFCPHCGKHQPPIGVSTIAGEIPGMGQMAIIIIFCGVQSCRAILQALPAPAMSQGRTDA